MSEQDKGSTYTPPDDLSEKIAQDKFGKPYSELTAHERIQVGGTKGGMTTKEGDKEGHYAGEGTAAGSGDSDK